MGKPNEGNIQSFDYYLVSFYTLIKQASLTRFPNGSHYQYFHARRMKSEAVLSGEVTGRFCCARVAVRVCTYPYV